MTARALIVGTVVALLIGAAPAAADTFDVTTSADGAGSCPAAPAQSPSCTLRAALTAAHDNGASSIDTIAVPAGTYSLTAFLDVNSSVVVIGHSAADTTIQGDGASFRVFKVEAEFLLGLQHLTVAKGAAPTASDGLGGDIQVNTASTLLLDHARVTGGSAVRGGGIGVGGGRLIVTRSLIDANTATAVAGVTSGDGGGVLSLGPAQSPSGNAVSITDSTITANKASGGAGLEARGNAANTTTLLRTTIAGNTSSSSLGGGLVLADAETGFTVTGSIVAGNLGVNPLGVGAFPIASNCSGVTSAASGGANVESLADCNFTAARDAQTTNPLLGALAGAGGETPVLPIPANSPAVDRIPSGAGCTGAIADQRDVPRPNGAACDAGAYEADVTPPPASIDSGPAGTVSGSTATFTFSSGEAGVAYQCRLDGPRGPGAFGPCVSPVTFGALAPGAYTFFLLATDPSGNRTTTSRAFTIAAPALAPIYHQTVVGQVVSGKVLVRRKGTKTFVALDPANGIPLGSEIDTSKGRLRLFSQPQPGRAPQSALFYDGRFVVTQPGAITQLKLSQPLSCSARASSAAAKKKKVTSRKLWGDGSGSFRTRGQYSAATVRGTRWLTQDSCGKTLTRVAHGVVSLQDLVKHKTFLLRAPHSYTARKKH